MITIEKSKRPGEFFVRTTSSKNDKKLSSTETFTQKKNAWKNIEAQMREFGSIEIAVEDNAGKKTIQYLCSLEGGKFYKIQLKQSNT